MSSSLRVAIIGCGSMGETHAPGLSELEDVRIGVLCDADLSRARALAAAIPADICTDDPARGFADDAVDAIYISPYHDTRSALAICAAETGNHVMMEKPLARTRAFIPSPILTIAQMLDDRWAVNFWANDPVSHSLLFDGPAACSGC